MFTQLFVVNMIARPIWAKDVKFGVRCFCLGYLSPLLCRDTLRGDFLQIRVSSAQKSNESDSRLRNLGKFKMAGNFFIVRVFPGSIYKHNRSGLVPL